MSPAAPTFPGWPGDARARVAAARVARLATVRPSGGPHVVPVTFALLDDDTVVTAVDDKPKTSTALQRLTNIVAEPRVSLLVDRYDEDWRQLWWVRLDGIGRVVGEEPDRTALLEPLVAKYEQYRNQRPCGPLVVMTLSAARAWSAAESTSR